MLVTFSVVDITLDVLKFVLCGGFVFNIDVFDMVVDTLALGMVDDAGPVLLRVEASVVDCKGTGGVEKMCVVWLVVNITVVFADVINVVILLLDGEIVVVTDDVGFWVSVLGFDNETGDCVKTV